MKLDADKINTLKDKRYITCGISTESILAHCETVDDLKNVELVTMTDPTSEIENMLSGGGDEDYKTYLIFEAVEDGQMIWKQGDGALSKTIQYSFDKETWTDLASTKAGATVDMVAGDKLYIKGNNATYSSSAETYYANHFMFTNKTYVYGNVNSLLGENNMGGFAFCGLFSHLRDASYKTNIYNHPKYNILLPSENLTTYCYYEMFYRCVNLTTPPELPATTLADACYAKMFAECTNLTVAPELPATSLTGSCYENMFWKCTSLTAAPELPATNLGYHCYTHMFSDCTNLTTAPVLPATTLANSCYMFMFENCTSLTSAPELPATTLAIACYQSMFYKCSSLNYIKCLATNINASQCVSGWVDGVAQSGTFVKSSAMYLWPTGVNGIPSNWTVQTA